MKENGKRSVSASKAVLMIVVLMLVSLCVPAFTAVGAMESMAGGEMAVESDEVYERIGPIRINDGDDFETDERWTGSGKEDDPYSLKENYSIDGSDEGYCIYIGNVSEHFVIEGAELYGASGGFGNVYYPNAGIVLAGGANGQIVDNEIYDNDGCGIYITSEGSYYSSSSYQVIGNNIHDNGVGITLEDSNENTMSNNTLSGNEGTGLMLEDSNENTMSNNTLENNGVGIHLKTFSNANKITTNLISQNDNLGTNLSQSFNNQLYLNVFLDNNISGNSQAYDNQDNDNDWDAGDPKNDGKGGNYWSDYEGEDRGDGIGDEPYNITGGGNQDKFPWLNPQLIPNAGSFDVSVDDITAGEKPSIEIKNAVDAHEGDMEGDYDAEITVDGTTHNPTLTFSDGEAEYEWSEITEADTYTANVTIDGVSDEDDFSVEAADADSLEITDDPGTITAGDSFDLTIEATDQYGNPAGNQTLEDFEIDSENDDVVYSSDNIDLDSDGEYTADISENEVITAAEKHQLTASADEVNDHSVTITVHPGDADRIVISPKDTTITAGQSQTYAADSYDEYNNYIDNVTSETTWSIAETGHNGSWDDNTYHSKSSGNWTVVGDHENIKNETELAVEIGHTDYVKISPEDDFVLVAGDERDFSASAYDSEGNLITDEDSEFNWYAEDGSISDEGLFHETEVGEYEVTATYEGKESLPTTVTVITTNVSYVTIEPSEDQEVTAGNPLDFSAVAYDDEDNVIEENDSKFEWENADSGTFLETEVGDYTVSARYEGVTSNMVNVTVEPGDIDVFKITPQEATVDAGESQEFTAVVYDEYGNKIENVTDETTWSDDVDEAEWDDNVITPITAGDWTVTGEYDDYEDTAVLTVKTAAEVHSIEISPSRATIIVGRTQEFTSSAYDEYGNEIDEVTSETTWSIDEEAGGEWNNGVYTAENPGEWTVTAEYEDMKDEASLTVTEHEMDWIEVDPSEAIIPAGSSQEFTATAHNESEGELGVVSADWTIDEEAGGEWKNGVYTAEYVGEWTVTGEYEGMEDQAELVVEAGVTKEVMISPSSQQEIEVGETVEFSAEAYDQFGNLVEEDDVEFEWESDGSSIDDTGAFEASEAGTFLITASYEGVSSEAVTVIVEDEAYGEPLFEIKVVDHDENVELGEKITVEYSVSNIGDDVGTQEIVFRVIGVNIEVVEVTLAPGEEETGEFTMEAEEARFGDGGEFDFEIIGDDEVRTVSIVVEEASEPINGDDNGDDDDESFLDSNMIFVLISIVVIIVIVLALISISTKSSSSHSEPYDEEEGSEGYWEEEDYDMISDTQEGQETSKYDMSDEEKDEIDLSGP